MRSVPIKIFRFIVALFLLPFVVAILALLAINVVDWDKHRGFVSGLVERFTDYKVEEIRGIKVGLLTSAEVGVDRIKIRHKTGLGALKAYESNTVHFQAKVFPLIFDNRLIVQSFILDGARIALKPSEEPEVKKKKGEEDKPLTLADFPGIFVNMANVRDFELKYVPLEKSSKPFLFTLANLGMNSPNNDKPAMMNAEGKVANLPFELVGAFGSFDAFRDKDAAYPARVEAKIADHTVEVRGKVKISDDVSEFAVDAKGPGLEKLKRALRLNIGDIPAYSLSFNLNKEPSKIRFEKVALQLGTTRVNGNGGLDFSRERLLVLADLRSPELHARDFKGLFQTSGDRSLREENEPPKPAGQYFSNKPIPVDPLKSIDADIQIAVDKFQGEKAGTVIDSILGRVRLNAGRLVLDPLRFGVAEGAIGGDLVFDTRGQDIQVAINLGARSINLDTLLGGTAKEIPVMNMKPTDMAKGILTGNLAIKMHGTTPMQLAQTVKGPVQLAVEDGKLSATIVELAGIDASETLGNWILKHPLKDLHCGLLSFEANEGVYATKAFIISTTDSNIIGRGEMSLPGNKVDFTLTTHPKDFSIGSLRSPIKINGPLNDIGVGLDPKPLIAKGAAALALGAIQPALALLPLVETGLGKSGGCSKYKGELQAVVAKAEKNVSREDLKETKSVGR